MDFFDRRAFLRGSTAAALGLAAPPDLFTSTASAQPNWDAGVVQHLLPAVSDQRILIKASFREPLLEGAGPACRQHGGRGPHERHGRRVLALPGDRSCPRASLYPVAHRQPRPHAVRAVDAVDVSRAGRAAVVVPGAVLHLRAAATMLSTSCPPPSASGCCCARSRSSPTRSSPTATRSTGTSWPRNSRASPAVPRRSANASPASSTARRWCSAPITRPCSSAPPVRRSCRSTAPTSARSRPSSSRTTTTISTTTRRPTTSSRSRRRTSRSSSGGPRAACTIRNSCPTWRAHSACRGPR